MLKNNSAIKKLILILIVLVSGIGIVLFLHLTADKPNIQNNSFNRRFIESPVRLIKNYKHNIPLRMIAGGDENTVYFSTDSVNIMWRLNWLGQWKKTQLNFDKRLINSIGRIYNMQIDKQQVYIFAKNMPAIIRFSLEKGKVDTVLQMELPAFTSSAILSKETFVVRKLATDLKGQYFFKYDFHAGTIEKELNISIPSNDGGLANDGQLFFSGNSGVLVYMHYYKNSIVTFDSNLNIIRNFSTIDTNFHAKLKTITYADNSTITISPNIVINQKGCLYHDNLFVCSNLKADNETEQGYWNNIPVDVYNIKTGTYTGSFYLPLHDGKLLKSLLVIGERLITLNHANYISIYELNGI